MKYSAEDRDNIPPVRGSKEELSQKGRKKSADTDTEKAKNDTVKDKEAGTDSDKNSEDNEPLEDNLENYTKNIFVKLKNERQLIKKRTKNMSSSERFKYILYYYKWTIFFTFLGILFIAYVISIIYENTRPVGFSYAIVNSYDISNDTNTQIIDDYLNAYDLDRGYKVESVKDITLNKQVLDSGSDQATTYKYMSFSTYCDNDYFDVLFTDLDGLKICALNGQIHPAEEVISADNMAKCSDRLVTALGKDGKDTVYGIDVSDIPAVAAMNLKYKKVYLCFPGNSERNITTANNFLTYLLSLK
ncbi:MAG: hypothetical protein IJ065_14600 [Eubacterium sp.]|nr:hypothetical protein [Eubacterium sp.]